jgi:outer membrane protein
MKGFKTFIAVGLLALAMVPVTVSAMGLEAAVGAWNQDPTGNLSHNGDNLSIRDDLRYSDITRIFGRVKINTPLAFPNIYLMATPMEYDATGSKGTSFHFGNIQFTANTPFSSELKLDHYDVGFYYGIPGLKTATAGVLNMDLGLDVRIIDFKTRVTGQDSLTLQTVTESQSFVLPAPMLYLGIQVKPLKWLAAEGEARGLTYGGSNYYYEAIGRAKLKPFGPVFVAGGYRYEKIKLDTNDVKADASFSGPFGEAGVEF